MDNETNFEPRICRNCGQLKSELRDGHEFILRCNCDWARSFHEQLVRTVHPDFYKKKLITIMDWSPPIFKGGGTGKFKSLVKVQKVVAINRLYDFCFRLISEDENTKEKTYSLENSIERGRNLYIRGPAGSGRGLLMSSIKIFAAARGLSTTPNPAEWTTFKAEMLEAESYRQNGEEARLNIAERYKVVDIMTLENIRGEGVNSYSDRLYQPKFKASTSIDDLITKRQAKPGAMIFTSPDFVGQMGDSIGDRLPDVLQADETALILMFSSEEADSLHAGIGRRLRALKNNVSTLQQEIGKSSGLRQKIDESQALESMKSALYFEALFSNLPLGAVSDTANPLEDTLSMTTSFQHDIGSWKRPAIEVWKKFKEDKEANNLAYQEGMKKAFIDAASESPELSSKMTIKERYETGRMMSFACQPKEKIDAAIEKAIALRKKMIEQ